MIDIEEVKTLFGRRLKAERILQGIDRKEMVDLLEVNKASLSLYETGKNFPSVENLLKIAVHLNVSIDYLLGRTEKKEVNE